MKLQEQEFFASRDPDIAKAPNAAARKRLIAALPATNPGLYDAFVAEKRSAEGVSHFMRNSGRYPLTGRGDINTYAVFAETDRELLGGKGRLGVILPTGIATDATTQYFFKDLVAHGAIASLYDFENAKPLFEGVHRSFKFCLLTLTGRDLREPAADFAFFAHDPTDLERPGVRFALSPEEITLLNPNTGTCPVFRSRRDAEITLGIYRRVPVLIREGDPDGNPWGVKFMRMFDMSNDAHLFRTRDELEAEGWALRGNVFHKGSHEMLPLYEAKMIHHYDHRWATYEPDGSVRDVTPEERASSEFAPLPRYWVRKGEVDPKLSRFSDGQILLGFRNVARSTDVRTIIASQFPRVAAGNSMPVILSVSNDLLQAALTSFVTDYVMRQKLGGINLNFVYFQQIPFPRPEMFRRCSAWSGEAIGEWIARRVMALNSPSQQPDRGHWMAELDAAFFHLYGIDRDDVDYIMETFPIVKRKDIAEHGEYRTKRLILEIYDAMAEAEKTGVPYASPFDDAVKQ